MKMIYNIDGESYKIPKETIEKYMAGLGISENEAVHLYLEEEGLLENEEFENINMKAEGVARKYTQVETNKKKQKRKPRDTSDPDKELIIAKIADFLSGSEWLSEGGCAEINIVNNTKIIEFDYNGNRYKLDLIKRR